MGHPGEGKRGLLPHISMNLNEICRHFKSALQFQCSLQLSVNRGRLQAYFSDPVSSDLKEGRKEGLTHWVLRMKGKPIRERSVTVQRMGCWLHKWQPFLLHAFSSTCTPCVSTPPSRERHCLFETTQESQLTLQRSFCGVYKLSRPQSSWLWQRHLGPSLLPIATFQKGNKELSILKKSEMKRIKNIDPSCW